MFIRTATRDDAALIADISRETFLTAFAAQNTKEDMDKFLSEKFSPELLMGEVGKPGHIFLLAFSGEEPAGYVFVKDGSHQDLQAPAAIEISRIYVRSHFIGKGIGKALMHSAISLGQERQKKTIWLGVWEHNVHAIQFYTSFGFTKFSEHEFVLGNDVQTDWLMQRKLQPPSPI